MSLEKLREFEAAKKQKIKEYRDKVVHARNNATKPGDFVWIKKERRNNKLDCEYYTNQKFKVLSQVGKTVEIKGQENGFETKRDLSCCLRCSNNTREQRRIGI